MSEPLAFAANVAAEAAMLDVAINGPDDDVRSFDERVQLLAMCNEALTHLARVAATLNDSVGADMPANDVETEWGMLHREPRKSASWIDETSRDRLLDDLKVGIANELSLNVATGEHDPMIRNVALRTVETVYDMISVSDPKAAARRRLGIALDEYKAIRESGYKVTIGVTPPRQDER
jgi:hypothetical protein